MRTGSIYETAVQITAKKRNLDAYMNYHFCAFVRNGMALIKIWEERKPPENRSVMRSLESRG